MFGFEEKESWLKLVRYTLVENYITQHFPDAFDIMIREEKEEDKYIVSFYRESDIYRNLEFVTLTPYSTSIEGKEFDPAWFDLVRSCNEGRKIEGWTYANDLVQTLDVNIRRKRNDAMNKAVREYNSDVKAANKTLKELGIEDEIEPAF